MGIVQVLGLFIDSLLVCVVCVPSGSMMRGFLLFLNFRCMFFFLFFFKLLKKHHCFLPSGEEEYFVTCQNDSIYTSFSNQLSWNLILDDKSTSLNTIWQYLNDVIFQLNPH